ncbi:hypothetical protein GCM10027203_58730 [Nonomuraea fastidiosa]
MTPMSARVTMAERVAGVLRGAFDWNGFCGWAGWCGGGLWTTLPVQGMPGVGQSFLCGARWAVLSRPLSSPARGFGCGGQAGAREGWVVLCAGGVGVGGAGARVGSR